MERNSNLHLPHKIRQVQAIKESYEERRMHVCNWLSQAVHDSVHEPEHPFFTD